MHIEIEIREIYGQPKAYPACDRARLFAAMLETKTLTLSALRHIEQLGFEISTTNRIGWQNGDVLKAGR